MIRIRSIAALAAVASMLATTPAFAAEKMDSMKGSMKHGAMMSGGGARFGGTVYTNNPKLTNTLAMVVAGGGPSDFSTATLFGVLAGDKAAAEKAKLVKQFGAAGFAQYVKTFDFVVNDSLKIVTAAKVKLPAAPSPDPKDGKALAAALYGDGVDAKTGAFNVEYMLDHLVTHPVHVQVMKDIDAKYGAAADTAYHAVTLVIFKDLKAVYGL
ncbi:MAG: hypothetical protein NVS2B8_00910 [Vulcanimicrobiaceae bacterium]